ncbi:hypothetical protein RJ639_035326 [Escallonia herrerae]|uniref:Uncharacterized protein n=1 Tax=Escallonia herrerae TaxID=1293975 RepID=A0AA89B7K7_9ASTE|nr:hypothetical protein RJ639_035326 [Escallonia herrerae]
MAKAIPRIGFRRNARTCSRKNIRRIPKGVIHAQASFNNTIVVVTDVRGRVISWASVLLDSRVQEEGCCLLPKPQWEISGLGYATSRSHDKGSRSRKRRNIMSHSQKWYTINFITVSTWTLQWKCVESRSDSKRLYYGRFIMSLLMKGQADTIGIAMRRALLGEIEGTCITLAKSEKIPHEYSTIVGIQESVHEILMNLKEINLYGTWDASIFVRGPGYVTAQDIISPPYVQISDNTQKYS